MGFSVIPAEHGKQGVEKALEEKPHLILMDIMMPGMDGEMVRQALGLRLSPLANSSAQAPLVIVF